MAWAMAFPTGYIVPPLSAVPMVRMRRRPAGWSSDGSGDAREAVLQPETARENTVTAAKAAKKCLIIRLHHSISQTDLKAKLLSS